MKKIELVKALIKKEIESHRALVKTACENELACFQDYLIQRKNELVKYPESHLEALVHGLELRKVA